MSDRKNPDPADTPETSSNADPEGPGQPQRIDEYIDDAYDVHEVDALDVPRALRSDRLLDEVADGDHDGIEEIDLSEMDEDVTVDSGARRHARDDAEMGGGMGGEPHSADELEQATVGDALRGDRGITREDERHGHALLDDAGEVEDEDEDEKG